MSGGDAVNAVTSGNLLSMPVWKVRYAPFVQRGKSLLVANITEDIRNGNTEYLNDFLNAVISEGIREGVTDIFGEGVERSGSDSEKGKGAAWQAAEYKPLAKLEELEEQNYNMIDNVLNNGAEKKEQEQTKGRISIKEKLAEKKAVIEQRDKAERTSPEKETEKKSQREM